MRRPREDRPDHAKTTNSDDAWIGFAQNDAGHSMFQSSPSAFFIFTSAIINYHSAQGSTKIKRKIEIIQPSRPEMSKYKLARVYPFHIKAKEGEEIMFYLTTKPEVPAVKGHIKATEGEEIMFYLTTKPEVPAVKGCQPEPPMPPPPLVVVIHGGPQARDPWGFNLMCQFSA
jgi:dipeptidyl aminopeptidase/acylaminoacyl peptidase